MSEYYADNQQTLLNYLKELQSSCLDTREVIHAAYYSSNPDNKSQLNHERSRTIYQKTKTFLDLHKDNLIPEEKAKIFLKYIELWSQKNLGIKDDYFDKIAGECSNKLCWISPFLHFPVVVGFNLKQTNFAVVQSNKRIVIEGINVNFSDVNFGSACFSSSYFENCDFSNCVTDKTIFDDCIFVKCNFFGANLSTALLAKARFRQCYLQDATFKKPEYGDYIPVIDDCRGKYKLAEVPRITNTSPRYPVFLSRLKIQKKKVTPKSVAHALWLSDDSSENTTKRFSEFLLWAKINKPAAYKEIEIKKALSQYVMMVPKNKA